MTGIGIIGQGYMGRTHAEAWTNLGFGDKIRYINAPGERSWTDIAPAAQLVTELDEVLLDPEIDRISICTPTSTHADIAIRALRAGKHVLLEKPIALSLEDARAIQDAAQSTDRVLMVAQVVRFFAGYVSLLAVHRSGRLGDVLSVRATRALPTPTWATWWPDEAQSGGVPVDFSIHDYDQANLFLGRPTYVRATRSATHGPLETTIEYADGGIAQVLSYPYLPEGSAFTCSLELVGTEGQASYRMASAAPTAPGDGLSQLIISTTDGIQQLSVDDNQPYEREVEYFNECIANGTDPDRSDIASAIEALKVSLATRQSLADGTRVVLR
jgi:predicted dehydrogenase